MSILPALTPEPRHLVSQAGAPDPLVSVIVVTLNASDLLRNCLRGLAAQDYARTEILVVDNGSTEDIGGLLRTEFPAARHIRLDRNHGFAGGNNEGIRCARGEYVALLNNDAVAEPSWLGRMVARAAGDPRTGAVACAVVDGNEPEVLDSFGVGVALDGMSRQAWKGVRLRDLPDVCGVFGFSGCACLLRKAALDEVGSFDERFFAYCEDTELALRLRRAGWRIEGEPAARVLHYYSRTGGAFSLRKVFWVERNHLWLVLKHWPLVLLAAWPFVTLYRGWVQLVAWRRGIASVASFFREASAWRVAWAICTAHAAALAGAGYALRFRRSFASLDRRGSRAWARELVRCRLSMWSVVTGRDGGGKAGDR